MILRTMKGNQFTEIPSQLFDECISHDVETDNNTCYKEFVDIIEYQFKDLISNENFVDFYDYKDNRLFLYRYNNFDIVITLYNDSESEADCFPKNTIKQAKDYAINPMEYTSNRINDTSEEIDEDFLCYWFKNLKFWKSVSISNNELNKIMNKKYYIDVVESANHIVSLYRDDSFDYVFNLEKYYIHDNKVILFVYKKNTIVDLKVFFQKESVTFLRYTDNWVKTYSAPLTIYRGHSGKYFIDSVPMKDLIEIIKSGNYLGSYLLGDYEWTAYRWNNFDYVFQKVTIIRDTYAVLICKKNSIQSVNRDCIGRIANLSEEVVATVPLSDDLVNKITTMIKQSLQN